jgi:hypothetical protein
MAFVTFFSAVFLGCTLCCCWYCGGGQQGPAPGLLPPGKHSGGGAQRGLLPLGTIRALYAAKLLCQTLFLAITLRQAGHRECLGLLLSLAYTAWPGAIEWKARRYRWAEA